MHRTWAHQTLLSNKKGLTRYPSSSSIPASTHVPEHVLRLVYWVAEVLALAPQCLRLPKLLEPVADVISKLSLVVPVPLRLVVACLLRSPCGYFWMPPQSHLTLGVYGRLPSSVEWVVNTMCEDKAPSTVVSRALVE